MGTGPSGIFTFQTTFKYVIVADDDSDSVTNTLDPKEAWKNHAGASQRVYYTVFAALTSARGLGDLSVANDNQELVHHRIRVGGPVQYQNDFPSTAPAGCRTYPTSSRFKFNVNSGSNTVQLLAYNSGSRTSTFFGNPTISGGYTYSQYDQFSCN